MRAWGLRDRRDLWCWDFTRRARVLVCLVLKRRRRSWVARRDFADKLLWNLQSRVSPRKNILTYFQNLLILLNLVRSWKLTPDTSCGQLRCCHGLRAS
ncbi:uncharacterized protein BDV14DRAFT_179244 [Aspergillus stella-maris]|uniref:uncharacterized protein n=1 Tax=Aspergillus stella-maris TaxID=1810926 RepID=UPI003CCE2A2E